MCQFRRAKQVAAKREASSSIKIQQISQLRAKNWALRSRFFGKCAINCKESLHLRVAKVFMELASS
jgi:hypothetical protein